MKDPKTKEIHNMLFPTQCVHYHIHSRDKRTGGKERKIETGRSHGDFRIALQRLTSGYLGCPR